MLFSYSYTTHSTFLPAVGWHFFKLRAVPCSNVFQRTVEARLEVSPACSLSHSFDGQGNAVQWGAIEQQHNSFTVCSEGIVSQEQPYALPGQPAPYYIAPTRLTVWDDAIRCLASRQAVGLAPFALAERLMHIVHHHIAYTPCHTTTATTALQVFADPQGVCQDYAHLLLAFCRSVGLHARYVNGLIAGEGQTHAWVEVSDGNRWLPFDPTHDIRPEWGYIKIAHGRDADDCPTNRGRIYGCTCEQMTARTTVIQTT